MEKETRIPPQMAMAVRTPLDRLWEAILQKYITSIPMEKIVRM